MAGPIRVVVIMDIHMSECHVHPQYLPIIFIVIFIFQGVDHVYMQYRILHGFFPGTTV